MIKKILLASLFCFLFTISVQAQNTSVSATVTDAGSVVWANGTYTFTFVPNTQYTNGPYFNNGVPYTPTTLSGSLNGSGAFTQSVPSNSTITPSGSFWIVTYCPQATAACQNSGKLTITGGSQNISASFIPAALVVQPGANQTVYNTNEVGTSIVGSQIYLIGTGLETCSAVTGTVCNTWVSSGGGGGVSALNTLTGAVTLAAGTNVTVTPSGNTLTIASSGGGGSLSGMTAGQVPIAATASTVTSSKALAGSGAGITTGPTTSVSGDAVSYTGTSGQTADSGLAMPAAVGNATVTQTIANGTATLGTSSITSGTCATVVTVAGTGIVTTDNIQADFNVDPTSTVGYAASVNGTLTIVKYPTSGNVNFKVCNNTASPIVPGAVTLNWRVVR